MYQLPSDWTTAPVVPLWPAMPPGSPLSNSPAISDLPVTFLTGIATPELRLFLPQRSNGRALMIIPGGAYEFVSIDNEGYAPAKCFAALGYTVFVLVYRLPGEGWSDRHLVPLQDAQRAIRLIRDGAAPCLDGFEDIVVIGFSAGGHLAACLATQFDQPIYPPVDSADEQSARPGYVGLIYPVIAMAGPLSHGPSVKALAGDGACADDLAVLSPAMAVHGQTPPMFLAHSLGDAAVPYGNALLMLDAMCQAGGVVEAHFFSGGGHGYGLGMAGTPESGWPNLFADWLDRTCQSELTHGQSHNCEGRKQ